jgi:hypothetical protein
MQQAPKWAWGWAGVAYGGLLAIGAAGGLVGAGWSLVQLQTIDPVEARVRQTVGLRSTETLRAWHDDSRAGDGSSGCALTDAAVVRVEQGRAVAHVPLAGAHVRLVSSPLGVQVGEVVCPFEPAEGAEWFASLTRAAVARAGRTSWRPVDPRVSP